jgi:para-aminobenzoate synthetase/4-amino-4-deoxychorismate lyase
VIPPDPARGVFETILVEERRAHALPDHLRRLRASVHALYDLELGEELEAIVAETLPTEPHDPCRLRVTASSTGVLQAELAPLGRPGRLELAPWTVPGGLGAHKWADRRAVDAATERLAATPLILDEDGTVLEAAWGNVWAVEGDRLVTPPADGRLLPGVTRGRLLRIAADVGLDSAEEALTLERLQAADLIVLTSALRLAVPGRLETPRTDDAVVSAIRSALR